METNCLSTLVWRISGPVVSDQQFLWVFSTSVKVSICCLSTSYLPRSHSLSPAFSPHSRYDSPADSAPSSARLSRVRRLKTEQPGNIVTRQRLLVGDRRMNVSCGGVARIGERELSLNGSPRETLTADRTEGPSSCVMRRCLVRVPCLRSLPHDSRLADPTLGGSFSWLNRWSCTVHSLVLRSSPSSSVLGVPPIPRLRNYLFLDGPTMQVHTLVDA